MKKLNKKGFTLVELIVVIVIIGILALIAVPVFSGFISDANDAKDTAEARSVYLAAQVLVHDTANLTDAGAIKDETALKADIAEMAGVEATGITTVTLNATDGTVEIIYNGIKMPGATKVTNP